MIGILCCFFFGALLSITAAAPVDESLFQQLMEEMSSFQTELKDVHVELQNVQVSPKANIFFQ